MAQFYVIDKYNKVKPATSAEWLEWRGGKKAEIAYTKINDSISISTIFEGIDCSSDDGSDPLLFETFIMGGKYGGETERYATGEKAERGHCAWVRKIEESLIDPAGYDDSKPLSRADLMDLT